MGLLDALFSGHGGNIFDMLRQQPGGLPSDQAQYGAAPQYSPMGAMAQAQPQFASQNVPQQPPPVISAQNGAQSPQMAAPPQGQPLPPALGGNQLGGNIGAGIQNFANAGGILPALVGGISGLMTGQRTDPAGMQQQNLKAQYESLRPILGDQKAYLAVMNPEVGKTLINEAMVPHDPMNLGNGYVLPHGAQKATRLFEPDEKYRPVVTKNADGSETQQAFEPSTGKFIGPAQPPPGKFSVDPSLTGKERLEALRAVDPLYARKIEAMVAGDIPMPTGVAALRPDAKRQIEDALAVDGSTSASDFQTRAGTRRDYASGIASRVTKSINTTIGHFATLDDSIDKLGNYSYFPKISNAVHDLYSSNLDKNYQVAKALFETNKEAAIKELDYALSGGHSSVSGSAELRDKFNRADSPETLHAAVREAMSLLEKRLQSHTKAYNEGTKSQREGQDFIYPENRDSFNKMLGIKVSPVQEGAPSAGAYTWSPDKGISPK